MKHNLREYHRRSIRLRGYDYAQPGAYFVTICAWQAESLFGEIVGGGMRLNAIGRLVAAEWERLPHHFRNIHLGAFVVMPNHVHGIVIIDDRVRPPVRATYPLPEGSMDGNRITPDRTIDRNDGSPLPPHGPPTGSLGAIVGQFKSRATRRIWAIPGVDRPPIWQRNYYEHIVRNDQEYQRISDYIQFNPLRWQEDRLYSTALTDDGTGDPPLA